MAAPSLVRRNGWIFDDLARVDDEWNRYEVVDGVLLVSPRPLNLHERVATALFRQLDHHAPAGWEGARELGLRLGSDGRVVDVAVVRAAPTSSPDDQVGYDPVDVLLAAEVVSRSSRKTDRLFKPAEYAEAGIPAYWRVETEPEVVVHVYELVERGYRLVHEVRSFEHITVPFPMPLDVPALTRRGG